MISFPAFGTNRLINEDKELIRKATFELIFIGSCVIICVISTSRRNHREV